MRDENLTARLSRLAGGTSRTGLMRRAALLLPSDRQLIELRLQGTLSIRQISRIVNAKPGNVWRRLVKIGNRLHEPIVLAMLDEHCPLPPEHRQIGLEHFLQNLSVPELAEKHCLTVYRVRQMLDTIRGWHRALRHYADWRQNGGVR